MSIPPAQLLQLQSFINICKKSTNVLYRPELSFFKEFLESLGATIPPKTEEPAPGPREPEQHKPKQEPKIPASPTADEEEIIESDVELDTSDIVEPDNDPPLPTGDDSIEVAEEKIDEADAKRGDALNAISDGDYEQAISLLGEAILLNPGSAAMYAKRASCLLKISKPNAAIRDCNAAIKMNPDNAQAYKFRGRANRMLGHWEESAADLGTACKIDYDDQANEWLKEVQPNAKKLSEHRRKYERLFEEKRVREQQERIRRMREERQSQSQTHNSGDSGSPGGFPGMPDLSSLLNDPEITEALQDPEVAAAFQDISQNPANMLKYQSNPKVAAIMMKMAQKMGGGMPGGMPGAGAGGFPGNFSGGFPPGFTA